MAKSPDSDGELDSPFWQSHRASSLRFCAESEAPSNSQVSTAELTALSLVGWAILFRATSLMKQDATMAAAEVMATLVLKEGTDPPEE